MSCFLLFPEMSDIYKNSESKILVFHGTTVEKIKGILKSGVSAFKVMPGTPDTRRHLRGAYFTDVSWKAQKYTSYMLEEFPENDADMVSSII